ncbi:hypothetical protein PSTG_06227 [Puccinia striiformis f. sp. tritici PST-78]|uniref:Major facilitator superfamily (MFS) profile domain-containing protein n=1 Tax=Puccinia striiformis f. sp. tritici PST-78 TaxID=1165861 RepID=A0A0L0VNG0_9BASI|nr:hypothetical protein PSTG_06227 [Puccinia striiformis f. sp. tritici PST-78]
MSNPVLLNPQPNPMVYGHSSSDIEPDLGPIVMTEKKAHTHEVIEKASPLNSLQHLQPPVEWKYAKFFPGGYSPNRQVPFKGKSMTWAVNIVAGIAIMFYGFDQGVMSGVNNTVNYQEKMGIFSQPQTEGDAAKIGGLLIRRLFSQGTFVGALIGGSLGDRIGRLKTIVFACFWAIIGASLQASAQNITWMCCARVITGIGTGQLNALVPVWTSELSHHSGRGAAMGFEFMLNIAGLATAYWIEFGLRGSNQELRWRLPLALQVAFLVVLLILVPLFPESPRWLAKMGRDEDARQILSVLRHQNGDSPEELSGRVELELQGILETVQEERKHEENGAISYWSMLFCDDPQHLRRRTWLIIWLQIMQELVGIGVVTVYAPTVFQQAGFSEYKADLLSGINDISYMLSVTVAIVTLDRMGRRVTLYWGAIMMGISLLICGIAARYVTDISLSSADRQSWGNVVTAVWNPFTEHLVRRGLERGNARAMPIDLKALQDGARASLRREKVTYTAYLD